MKDNPIDKKFNEATKVVSTSTTVWRFIRFIAFCLSIFGFLWIVGPIVANNNRPGGYIHLETDLILGISSLIVGIFLIYVSGDKLKSLQS
ncbi:MAG TPA: hypothetical protein VL651_03100, partial [Bacteroidia bacterium]|nr:hypothetical protein [Bacteroidia bacterium]